MITNVFMVDCFTGREQYGADVAHSEGHVVPCDSCSDPMTADDILATDYGTLEHRNCFTYWDNLTKGFNETADI